MQWGMCAYHARPVCAYHACPMRTSCAPCTTALELRQSCFGISSDWYFKAVRFEYLGHRSIPASNHCNKENNRSSHSLQRVETCPQQLLLHFTLLFYSLLKEWKHHRSTFLIATHWDFSSLCQQSLI